MGLSRQPPGTAEPFPSSSKRASQISALPQETCSFPGEAETAFELFHAALLSRVSVSGYVSVPRPGLAKPLLCRGVVVEDVDAGGLVMLACTGHLPRGPSQLL